MMTLRLSPAADRAEHLLAYLRTTLSDIAQRPGATGAHVLQTETPAAAVTKEQQIRGGDGVADWIVLVSGYDAAALANLAASRLDAASLGKAGAQPGHIAAHYDLRFAMAKTDLARGVG